MKDKIKNLKTTKKIICTFGDVAIGYGLCLITLGYFMRALVVAIIILIAIILGVIIELSIRKNKEEE